MIPELKLGIGSPPKSTGPHTVKLIAGKEVKGKHFKTGEEYRAFKFMVKENGEKKVYQTRILDKEDPKKLHYLFARLVEIPNGTEVILEMKKGSVGNYIDLSIPGREEDGGIDQRIDQTGAEEEESIQVDEEVGSSKTAPGEYEGAEDMF